MRPSFGRPTESPTCFTTNMQENVCVCALRVCVRACVGRERDDVCVRDGVTVLARQRERSREREAHSGRECMCVCVCARTKRNERRIVDSL